MRTTSDTSLRGFREDEVVGWLQQDIEYVENSQLPQRGIELIKEENSIEFFDLVLIDGSEFTGEPELDLVYGAKYILLDDIRAFKNYNNYQKLKVDPNYELIEMNYFVRYGYAIFKKREVASESSADIEKYVERFERIYKEKLWGENEQGEGFSGGGSLMEAAEPYYQYLVQFLHDHEIKSVVDLGCGDWTLSKHIDWSGIDYVGYDVVQSVIDKNRVSYANNHIHFISGNFLTANIPEADLLICAHVLQHMPNQDVAAFVKLLPKFKYCLILDAMPHQGENADFPIEETFPFWEDRGIDLTLPPFSVPGKQVLVYRQGFNASGMDILTLIDNRK
jgi:2-polyprenyl-3-methyl-5-hydroxy-6-metoxy-1,4-benzoquinol methylase